MKKWLTYLNERSPLPALTFLSLGIGLSTSTGLGIFDGLALLMVVVLNNLVFIQMRLGDELKDFENDKIINPTRPLPRGLLTTEQVSKALLILFFILTLAALCVGVFFSWQGGVAFLICPIFAWLMYKEFYIGKGLSKEPMLYALTHQVIVFPLFGWFGLALAPELITNPFFIGWLLANFGVSFTFEICRKLNPNAHKLAGTYAHHYGPSKTVFFIAILMLYTLLGAYVGNFFWFALPPVVLLLLSLLYWIKNPSKYKIPAGLSALNSIISLWAPAIIWAIKRWA